MQGSVARSATPARFISDTGSWRRHRLCALNSYKSEAKHAQRSYHRSSAFATNMPLGSPNARRETLVRAEERDSLLVSSLKFHEAQAPTMDVKANLNVGTLQH